MTENLSRSRRAHPVRARTYSLRRSHKRDMRRDAELYPYPEGVVRPKTRGDCAEGPRPCPFVSCKYHLALDVQRRTGSLKVNFPDLEPDEIPETCALDVADRGGARLEEVGRAINMTRERVRQVEVAALAKIAAKAEHLREQPECKGHSVPTESYEQIRRLTGKRRLPVWRAA